MPASATVKGTNAGLHVESVYGLQADPATRVDEAIGRGREPHLLRLRGRGAEPEHDPDDSSHDTRMNRP